MSPTQYQRSSAPLILLTILAWCAIGIVFYTLSNEVEPLTEPTQTQQPMYSFAPSLLLTNPPRTATDEQPPTGQPPTGEPVPVIRTELSIKQQVVILRDQIKQQEAALTNSYKQLRLLQETCNHPHEVIDQEWLGENGPGPEWYECTDCGKQTSCFPPMNKFDKLPAVEQQRIRDKYKSTPRK